MSPRRDSLRRPPRAAGHPQHFPALFPAGSRVAAKLGLQGRGQLARSSSLGWRGPGRARGLEAGRARGPGPSAHSRLRRLETASLTPAQRPLADLPAQCKSRTTQ